jgi:predicted Zn-dependent peptidase
MTNLARQQIFFGQFFSMEELLAAIEAVTPEQVLELARESFVPDQLSLTVLGKVDDLSLDRNLFRC